MSSGENTNVLGSEVMALRQLHGQFGSYVYDSGIIAANADVTAVGGYPLLTENTTNPYGSDVKNDRLFASSVGATINGGISFGSYQYVDLRDMFDDRECMDDIVINVQRQLDTPVPSLWVNMGLGPIIETFAIINDEIDTTDGGEGWSALSGGRWHKIGYGTNTAVSKLILGNYKSILYRETRRYTPNTNQSYRSGIDMGSYVGTTGTPLGQQNNQWLSAYQLESRTVGGYPSRLIGPGMTVVRIWTLYCANRSDRSITGGGPSDTLPTNYEFAEARMQLTIPMLQWNIIGNRRDMTDGEIAVDYSSKLIMQDD